MPQAIGAAIFAGIEALGVTGAAALGSTAVLGTSIAGITGSLILVGGSIALQMALAPGAPSAQSIQAIVNQSLAPRRNIYGQVLVGGTRAWADARNASFTQIVMLASRKITAINARYIGDIAVDLDGSGFVTSAVPQRNAVLMEEHLGAASQAASALMLSLYSDVWTSAHHLNGIAYVVVQQLPVDSKKFSSIFPQSWNTQYKWQVQGHALWNPNNGDEDPEDESTWSYQELSAHVILDYLRHSDGMRIPTAKIDIPSFQDAVSLHAERIDLKDGGDESRYRCWGAYEFNEEPKNVLTRMLATCDGQLVQGPSGKVGFRGGKWNAPVRSISTKNIPVIDIAQGNDKLDSYNKLRTSFTYPDVQFQPTEIDAYNDLDSQAAIGVIDQSIDLVMVPSWGQAGRLAKIKFHRDNHEWTGTLTTHLAPGMDLFGEPTVTAEYDPAPDIGELFNTDFAIAGLNVHADWSGIDATLTSLSSDVFDWNPATEEPPKPAIPTPLTTGFAVAVPDPTSVALTMIATAVSGSINAVVAHLAWDAAPYAGLVPEAQIKLDTDGDDGWKAMGVSGDETYADYAPLIDGSEYDARVRFTRGGVPSNWVDASPATAVADSVAPDPAVAGTLTSPSAGVARIPWTMPNSANVHDVQIKRNTIGTYGSATLVATINGAPSSAYSYDNSGLTSGNTYYFWVTARNASGVAATPDGPHSVLIT